MNIVSSILPSQLECPGGNASWESSEVKHNARICEGQRDVCNQTMKIAWNCPENSFCRPYGPGFFECSCLGDFHGYKCLRQGEFPILEVLGILSASTAVLSSLLWFTQRRRVRSV
ncbi:hypothetical protein DNTS_009768 [Danionella cerebrum]|uniref:EGF-like domain-containing protein n=1 Tax=Danionella cerebrum TaxID=2873325 RepID=A0A553N053_9TELE|nr:hypothetical protein DNTS_009768 [Danionella translucida]